MNHLPIAAEKGLRLALCIRRPDPRRPKRALGQRLVRLLLDAVLERGAAVHDFIHLGGRKEPPATTDSFRHLAEDLAEDVGVGNLAVGRRPELDEQGVKGGEEDGLRVVRLDVVDGAQRLHRHGGRHEVVGALHVGEADAAQGAGRVEAEVGGLGGERPRRLVACRGTVLDGSVEKSRHWESRGSYRWRH